MLTSQPVRLTSSAWNKKNPLPCRNEFTTNGIIKNARDDFQISVIFIGSSKYSFGKVLVSYLNANDEAKTSVSSYKKISF